MVNSLRHRGPDDDGVAEFQEDGVFLGMTRLSIIDIEGGHQPMSDERRRYSLVFNGEIYNFKELRRGTAHPRPPIRLGPLGHGGNRPRLRALGHAGFCTPERYVCGCDLGPKGQAVGPCATIAPARSHSILGISTTVDGPSGPS